MNQSADGRQGRNQGLVQFQESSLENDTCRFLTYSRGPGLEPTTVNTAEEGICQETKMSAGCCRGSGNNCLPHE